MTSNKTFVIPLGKGKSIPFLFVLVVMFTIPAIYTSIFLSESSVGDQLIPFFSLSIVLGLLGVSIAKSQSSGDSAFQVKLFAISFVIRVILAILFYQYFVSNIGEPFLSFGNDDFGYHTRALDLASNWASSGIYYPSHHAAGYDSLIALFYLFLGPVPLVVRLLNCFAGSLAAVYSYRIGNYLFGKKIGRLAGFLIALMPDFLFWSVVQYRDIIIAVLLLYLVWFFIARFNLKISFTDLIIPIIMWIFFVLLHPHGAFGLLAAIILYVGIMFRREIKERKSVFSARKIFVWAILIILFIGSFWFIYELKTETLYSILDIGENREAGLQKRSDQESLSNIFFGKSGGIEGIAVNFIRFFFPVFIPVPSLSLQLEKIFLSLGSVIWYFLFPCSVYSIFYFIKKKRNDTMLLISVPIIFLMGIFIFFYSGSFRYKIQFMPLLIILSAFGISRVKRWFMLYISMLYILGFAFVLYLIIKL